MLGNTTAAKRGLCVTICSRRTCKSARRCEAADLHVVGLKQSQGDLRGHQCAHAAYLCAEGGEGRGRRSEHLYAGRVGRDLLAAYVEERRGERRDALNVVDTVPGPCRDPKCVTRLRLDDPAARSSVVISSHLMQSHSISRNLVSSYAISCLRLDDPAAHVPERFLWPLRRQLRLHVRTPILGKGRPEVTALLRRNERPHLPKQGWRRGEHVHAFHGIDPRQSRGRELKGEAIKGIGGPPCAPPFAAPDSQSARSAGRSVSVNGPWP